MSKFQGILLGVCGFFIIVAVLTFAMYRGGGSIQANVVVWGDISGNDFNMLLSDRAFGQDPNLTIQYVEKSAATLEEEFTEALAQGVGPDLVILTQDKFWKNRSKLLPIPYTSVGEGDFKDIFIEEGELFLTQEGIYALPLLVDPLVLYYNRDHLTSAGYAKPISYWDELYSVAATLTKKDGAGNITQSAIPLGETRNIPHFKDILSLLMLQAGTPITGYVNEELRSLIIYKFDMPVVPGEAALEFYTQFANPTKPYFSWNRVMPDAQTRFTSGDASYYVGYASELRALRNKNPTLNFSVAPVPQSRVSGKVLTLGQLRGVAITRGTRNPAAALAVAMKLVSKEGAGVLAQITLIPPARRDLLASRPTDSVFSVFYQSALQAKGWIDPDDEASEKIFADMTESITSGRARTIEAVNKASRELDSLTQ